MICLALHKNLLLLQLPVVVVLLDELTQSFEIIRREKLLWWRVIVVSVSLLLMDSQPFISNDWLQVVEHVV